ncbi:hypothetical protein [Priestia aryabhattai]|uniref:Uncharacterized protein n=1 Tax=Priestia aryabhattai TaxID=412384 RepID=A0ABD7X4H7_PRIAR|nr:hypothetical protein [Priestia aryabhattai]WEA47317.1 hypothetical protein PWO00_28490 [Priestia aryabhattai]
MKHDTADFVNHLEEQEKALSSNDFHVYECIVCGCTFAVSQNFVDQSVIVCPSCWSDQNVLDKGAGTMMMKGE